MKHKINPTQSDCAETGVRILTNKVGDYIQRPIYTVLNYNNMNIEDMIDWTKSVSDDTKSYYESCGWTNVCIEDTNGRFNKRFKITGTRLSPACKKFSKYSDAKAYADSLKLQ